MIIIKSPAEIEKMRQAGRKTARIMAGLEEMMKPGVTPLDLNEKAAEIIAKEGAKTAFKGYMGYPAHICVSVNEEVVHGIPRNRPLKEGDIVGVDLGAVYDGFYGDMARTFPIGKVTEEQNKLIQVTEESLWKGIEQCVPDNRLGDISHAVEQWVLKYGFSVVRDFVGHGIGTKMHEDPPVPNYGKPKTGPKLQVGMVLAIEPMVNLGAADVRILSDGWTVVTKDGKVSAHFEHTVAITENGPEVLTKL
jgi:methionyl aminopeptidase